MCIAQLKQRRHVLQQTTGGTTKSKRHSRATECSKARGFPVIFSQPNLGILVSGLRSRISVTGCNHLPNHNEGNRLIAEMERTTVS